MIKLLEDLKAAGWVETTLGECRVGDEVLLIHPHCISRPLTVTRVNHEQWIVETSDEVRRSGDAPVLRAPRPDHPEGTVALIRQPGLTWPMPGLWMDGAWHTPQGQFVDPVVCWVICDPDGLPTPEALLDTLRDVTLVDGLVKDSTPAQEDRVRRAVSDLIGHLTRRCES